MIWVSEPKTEILNGGLNSSSWKTNRRRRTNVSNLEAPGMQFQFPKLNYDYSDTFFSLFIYLGNFFYEDKNFETTKARNLESGQMISLNMKFFTCLFGGAM